MVRRLIFSFVALMFLCTLVSAETQVAYDGFESGDFSGGVGWKAAWYKQGAPTKVVSTEGPYAGAYHLKMQGRNGYVERSVNLVSYSTARLTLYAKVNSFEGSDFADLLVSSDGVNWHVLRSFTVADSDDAYHYYDFNITQYGLSDNFYVAVDTEMSSNSNDYLYFDEIKIVTDDYVEPPYNWTGNIPSWHIQFNPTPENPAADVQYWNLDLFDVPNVTMQELKSQGVFVICYFSGGSWEDWRPDAGEFPQECLGNSNGWPGEKWLDTRCPEVRQIMVERMSLGIANGCDGFDPDNMDGYQANTGFDLTEEDAVDYYGFLADYAHNQTKKIGLKNALLIIPDVLDNLDWEINEQCYQYNECNLLQPVLDAGKPVFHIEYPIGGQTHEELADEICNQSNQAGLATLIKNQQLDEFEISCLEWGNQTEVNQTFAYDGFEDFWNGGFGWGSGWYHEGDASIVTGDGPFAGTHHLRLRRNNGYVDRVMNLSGVNSSILTLQAKVKSFEGSDHANLMISPNGVNWTVLKTFDSTDSDNQYHEYVFDISLFMSDTTWIALDAEMSGTRDYLYADEVRAQSFL
jgi:hypothetical protein